MKKSDDQGFTLVELLIVIVILGILATVVVFSVSGITDSGRESACKTEAKSIATAVEAYYAQNDASWPSDDTEIDSYFSSSGSLQFFTISAGGGSTEPTVSAQGGVTLPDGCSAPVFGAGGTTPSTTP